MTEVKAIRSLSEFESIRDSGKLIYIDFYTTWCGPCKFISPIFEQYAKDHSREGAVEFYNVDIDAVPELASKLKIRSIPTFQAYKNGEQLGDTIVGANQGGLTALVKSGLGQQ